MWANLDLWYLRTKLRDIIALPWPPHSSTALIHSLIQQLIELDRFIEFFRVDPALLREDFTPDTGQLGKTLCPHQESPGEDRACSHREGDHEHQGEGRPDTLLPECNRCDHLAVPRWGDRWKKRLRRWKRRTEEACGQALNGGAESYCGIITAQTFNICVTISTLFFSYIPP